MRRLCWPACLVFRTFFDISTTSGMLALVGMANLVMIASAEEVKNELSVWDTSSDRRGWLCGWLTRTFFHDQGSPTMLDCAKWTMTCPDSYPETTINCPSEECLERDNAINIPVFISLSP